MTARLILNLKAASAKPTAPKHHYGFDGAHSVWEANIIGNIGNEFEGGSTGFSSTTESMMSKGKQRRRSEVQEVSTLPPYYELEERQW